MDVKKLLQLLSRVRFIISTEKDLQAQIEKLFISNKVEHVREKKLTDGKSIIDFFISGIGIEIKIKGNRVSIYKQVTRYSECKEIKSIVIITTRTMPFPETVNGKDIFILNLNKAWL